MEKICDQFKDCMTNYDETNCGVQNITFYGIKPPAVINFDAPGGFTMTPLPGNITQCPETHFQCHDDGYCLPVYVKCNDVFDCPGHEDEVGCLNYVTCPGFYRCRNSYEVRCVHVNHLCDGLPHCPLHDDELMCNIACPASCVCHGFAFFCDSGFLISSFPLLRFLEAPSSGMRMSDITHNVMLIHLGLQACGLRKLTEVSLPNLRSLDLSQNQLSSVNFSHFARMPRLTILNLAANPLSGTISYFQSQDVHKSLTIFNISHVQANAFNMSTFSDLMPNLQVLDLSCADTNLLWEKRLFPNIRVLNLQGRYITDFTPDFMKHMTELMFVFADNFKLCCSVILPDNFRGKCVAPPDEISSCDDVLKSISYRFTLVALASLAVLGNFSGFVYHMYFLSGSAKTAFVIFALHLCVSDFLMGVYLVFIVVADQVYSGSYIWNETEWKKSSACSTAGVLSLLSSEVSAFLICFITLDRFFVLYYPFSQLQFTARSAHIVCVIIWPLGLTLAMVPLLPVTSRWEFFHQTGICIPLFITGADFPGRVYSFAVMIVCNLTLFIMVGVGQSLIFWSVRSNTISNQLLKTSDNGTSDVQYKEAIIAERHISVAMTDFLCWFPMGLCGILDASGVPIPDEVNVAITVCVVPLNSALNPFLYTLNILLEKRRKARELRFQKLLRNRQKS